MFGLRIEQIIFLFFFFSVSGWVGESIMESAVRKRFVSKGVFRGPYVPVHGVGAFVIYGLCMPLSQYPPLVFLVSTAASTLVEYLAAIFLENVFSIRGWDYETYPFTKWCHYKRRIALTTSLFFGLVALGIVYFYWDFGLWLMNLSGPRLLLIADCFMCAFFLFDVFFTGTRCIRNKLAGIPNITIGLEQSTGGQGGAPSEMKNTEQFDFFAKEILENEVFAESKAFVQHGSISVYEHSLSVARLSFTMGEFFGIADRQSLVRAALLHDFFLYDWHVPEKMWSLHGWTHPVAAAENAKKYFNASDKEYSLIRSHMWPYTLLHPPQYREGWLICLADKLISAGETLFRR